MKILHELKIILFQEGERDIYLPGPCFRAADPPHVSSTREAEFREARAGGGKRGLETWCISELQKLLR